MSTTARDGDAVGHIVDLADLISKLRNLFGTPLAHLGEPVWPIHSEAVAVPMKCDKRGRAVAHIHFAFCGSANVLSGDGAPRFLLIVTKRCGITTDELMP